MVVPDILFLDTGYIVGLLNKKIHGIKQQPLCSPSEKGASYYNN